jgi:hypothetical protein
VRRGSEMILPIKTQGELDAALTTGHRHFEFISKGEFDIRLNHERVYVHVSDSFKKDVRIYVWGYSRIEAKGSCRIIAKEHSFIEAWDNCNVLAKDNCRISARDNCNITVWDRCTVETRDNCNVDAYGNCRVSAQDNCNIAAKDNCEVEAKGHCSVRCWSNSYVVASDSCRINARGRCRVEARHGCHIDAFDRCNVEVWNSCNILASDNCSIVASGSCRINARNRCRVEARGSCNITATDNCYVEVWDRCNVETKGVVSVSLWDSSCGKLSKKSHTFLHSREAKAIGGEQTVAYLENAGDWLAYHGIEPKEGIVTLYKAVNADFSSGHDKTFFYKPGTQPLANGWNEEECSLGLHFCPTPNHAWGFYLPAKRFVACPVSVSELLWKPGWNIYKAKAPRLAGKCYEVDVDGNPIN